MLNATPANRRVTDLNESPLTGVNGGPWENVPRTNIVIFLLAVFCVFAGVGFASDSVGMGRAPVVRFVLSVLVSAGFAVCYAVAGITLRRRFWLAFVPLFLVQFIGMGVLGNVFPGTPEPQQYDATETVHLRHRMIFDSVAIMISVVLGYIGFLAVSIREGRRHIRMQREKASLESEMAAAREIQRVMVPQELPATPGYELECVYRPAAQVGGDFFQVIPLKSGGSLVIIGDVSGKGLSAAMIVSMVVGMLGTITSFTEEPSAILTELNRRLLGRVRDGFVTCAALRLDPEGRLTVANAGHLAPYLNGAEMASAGSLPLGMSASTVYEQSEEALRSGDRVFLLTDGVVEAQTTDGKLLGFGRMEGLLREGATAAELAEAAQLHGQADDITVVCVHHTAAVTASV